MELSKDTIHPLIGVALDQASLVQRNLNLKRMEVYAETNDVDIEHRFRRHEIDTAVEAQELIIQLILNYLTDRGALDEYI